MSFSTMLPTSTVLLSAENSTPCDQRPIFDSLRARGQGFDRAQNFGAAAKIRDKLHEVAYASADPSALSLPASATSDPYRLCRST